MYNLKECKDEDRCLICKKVLAVKNRTEKLCLHCYESESQSKTRDKRNKKEYENLLLKLKLK
jgi:hypothetical protein